MTISKIKVAAALVALFLPLSGTAQIKTEKALVSKSPGVPMPKSERIPMADFKKLMASGSVVILDVRSNATYQRGHIPGALSMPGSTIDAATADKLSRMGKVIATYCACPAEHTAAAVAQDLQLLGVPAQAVVGGWNLWVEEKNPIKTGPDAR
ncbi:MAG: rhodanese-like domain-containing protein [Vicinamibacteria bacterium]